MARHTEVVKHLRQLQALGMTGTYTQLRALEIRANNLALQYCNKGVDEPELSKKTNYIRTRFAFLFGDDYELAGKITINLDARGCALKLDDKYNDKSSRQVTPYYLINHRDWGGDAMLAPFTPFEMFSALDELGETEK